MFTCQFYTWYLKHLADDARFGGSRQFTAAEPQWLTPAFIARFDAIARKIGMMPLLQAQDFSDTWWRDFTVIPIKEAKSNAVERVELGSHSDFHKVIVVRLELVDAQWRISSVENADR